MRRNLRIPAGKLAALFIDLQEEHRQDQRYLVEDFGAVLENAARLQRAARAQGIPILHVAYVVDPAEMKPFNPVQADGTPAFSAKGSPLTAICAETQPLLSEPVLIKHEPSAFGVPELEERLVALDVNWLLISGVWTEACIDASVKDAIRSGFRVLLVKDACGSGTGMMHQVGILNLANRLYGGAVVDTQTACKLLAGETVEAWQVAGSVPLRFTHETVTGQYNLL